MAKLDDIIAFCDTRVKRASIIDFPGANNGLQFQNSGKVHKIGAAVDAGLIPFQKARDASIDFLIVHHGLFWSSPSSISGSTYAKYKLLFEADMAVYSSHLPLDAHPEIGNNACIARALGLEVESRFLEYEGTDIGIIAHAPKDRTALQDSLKKLFPASYQAIEYGSEAPKRVGISSGSGASVIAELKKHDIDTLITGELRQQHFNVAQEEGFNLYPCGHYATEVFGVQALAKEVAEHFNLPWEFIETDCPL
ncbi:MAG TPA: Nif3-like dinuclear metal center hexameric protein [Opitutae bacterium]|nr:Nif3-like dinuclear metal center hexameric protein [Opitutae bacterium]|tara:strand:- start:3438 stop:4193 length:756 start_codon:yes stop_codon:yes gene_type:complete